MRMDKHDNANQANDFEARTQEEGKSFYKSSETRERERERERNELIVSLLSVSLCCYMFPDRANSMWKAYDSSSREISMQNHGMTMR